MSWRRDLRRQLESRLAQTRTCLKTREGRDRSRPVLYEILLVQVGARSLYHEKIVAAKCQRDAGE